MSGSRPSSYCKPGDDDPALASLNMITYSHPGEGKSVFLGSAGEGMCILVSDPEGIVSARSMGFRPHSIQVTDYGELQEAYEWFKESAEPKRNGIRQIGWDSLTLFQDRALIDDIMQDAHDDNPKQDWDVPSRREYLQSQNRIGRYVRNFVDLPYDFIISAHVMDIKAPEGDGMLFAPLIQGGDGKFTMKICGYMNVVGYLHKGKSAADANKLVQKLQVRRAGRVYAKDRFDCLGDSTGMMERPTLAKVNKLVSEWREGIKKAGVAAKPAPSSPRSTTATGK